MIKKEYRLKRSEDIASICQRKVRVYSKYFYIYYRKGEEHLRVAFSVSKKFGHAFERNYAKRILRKMIYKNMDLNTPIDMVVIAKPDLKLATDADLNEALQFCLKLMKRNLISEEQTNEKN